MSELLIDCQQFLYLFFKVDLMVLKAVDAEREVACFLHSFLDFCLGVVGAIGDKPCELFPVVLYLGVEMPVLLNERD